MKVLERQIHGFVRWMEKDGMLARWEERRKMGAVSAKRRELNEKIRVEKAIQETLNEEGKSNGRN